MRVWSLFSGVGGFDLGFQRAGAEVTLNCEFDPWRRRVLAERFPNARQHDDVRTLVGSPDEEVDVLCGGFPCQDLSVAGRRAGLGGERSGLFFEFARIAEELKLADREGWVFLENVPGLLSSDGGRDFGIVLQTLADLGFSVAYRVLDSRHHGVPQRRRRVFLVGHSDPDRARAVLLESERSSGNPRSGQGEKQDDPFDTTRGAHRGGERVISSLTTRAGNVLDDQQVGQLIVTSAYPLARRGREGGSEWELGEEGTYNALRAGEGGSSLQNGVAFFSENQRAEVLETEYARQLTTGGGKPGQGYPAVRVGLSVRRLTPIECERLQGFPDDWTAIDGLPEYAKTKSGQWRCKTGTPDSKRYAAMGDAVTVNVIEQIAARMVAA